MEPRPISDPQIAPQKSSSQAIQPPGRPSYWGVDLDRARRPGFPMMRKNPQPFPNARSPIERQPGEPASPKHGRPGKPMPPVFGTAVPLRGISGAIRKLAYKYPDHYPRHWFLMMLGDRVDAVESRPGRVVSIALALVAFGVLRRALRG